MAGTKDLLTHAGFPLGVNNTDNENELPRDEAGAQLAVREGVNVHFSAQGKPSRRPGYTKVQACTRGHSAWSDDRLPFGFQVDAENLLVVHADGSQDVLVSGLAPGLPLSYTLIGDAVYWSNGVQSGQITLALDVLDWCCPHPNGQPTLALGAGALDPGEYQVAVTFLDAFGRESGAARAVPITVPAGGAIALSNIPQPPADGRVRVYMTNGHDGSLRAAVTLASGIHDYTLTQRAEGRACNTLLLRPMPPGQLVAYGNSRQYVARGKLVLYSPPLRYGMFNPRTGASFNRRVDMLAFVGDGTERAGLFVSDGKRTYWLGGSDPLKWAQVVAYPYGALPGQLAWAPGEVWGLETRALLPVWQARNGRLVVGLPGGQVHLPQPRDGEPDAVYPNADAAALLFRVSPGDNRVISALKGAGTQAFAMRDQLIAREYRHNEP